MTMPDRPDPGEATLAAWGRDVHDAVFTPLGCRVAGGGTLSVGTTLAKLPLNTAVDDPGGWLNATTDQVTVSVDGAGLYEFSLDVRTDSGTASERTRVHMRRNGVRVVGFFVNQDGATFEIDGRGGLIQLDGSDVIEVWASTTGGTNPVVNVEVLSLVRRGLAIGT